jgi:protein O-mannosyl-transferase
MRSPGLNSSSSSFLASGFSTSKLVIAPGSGYKAGVPTKSQPRFPVWLMAASLALVTIVIYWPATGNEFVSYDDPLYVTENSHVQAGLTWEGLVWAFGRIHGEGTYWHPLTWVSHMADCQIYGLKPWGHHLTSILLHAVNAVLVFLVFRRMTGVFWRCAMLAALFALHPLQVDSVAWVTERKNLLSVFFWLLTTWAYVRYAETEVTARAGSPRPTFEGQISPLASLVSRRFWYCAAVVLFALGLMCKPVLVTLPFVLFLLDYWPLQRFQLSTLNSQRSTVRCLLREKIPFFVLAVASSVITLMAHDALGSLLSISRVPWDTRMGNALVSYVHYIAKTFWPTRLAVFYPYPTAWPVWEVVTCGLLLLVISGLVLGTARSRPWLFVGWFWFLGVLVPFIGLVQAGEQAMADRFMYAPAIGIIVAVIWGLHGLTKGGRYQQIALAVGASAVTVLCLVLTRQQLGYWKNSESLFRHALEVTENNYPAHIHLGTALRESGQMDEAIRHFQEAIRLKSDNANAHITLGIAQGIKGRMDEAIGQFREAIRLKPDYADAHYNLGTALGIKGQVDEAVRQFQEAIRLNPDHAEAHYNLGIALDRKGQSDEAIGQFQKAIRLRPNYAQAYNNLGKALYRRGRNDEAIRQFQEALRLRPDYPDARKNLDLALDIKAEPARQTPAATNR